VAIWPLPPPRPAQHQFQNTHFTCKQQSGSLQSNRLFHTGFQFTASTAPYTVPRKLCRKKYSNFTLSPKFLQMLQPNCRNNIKRECQLYCAIPNSNEPQVQIPTFAFKPADSTSVTIRTTNYFPYTAYLCVRYHSEHMHDDIKWSVLVMQVQCVYCAYELKFYVLFTWTTSYKLRFMAHPISGRPSPGGGPGSIPDEFRSNLWRTKWHFARSLLPFLQYSLSISVHNCSLIVRIFISVQLFIRRTSGRSLSTVEKNSALSDIGEHGTQQYSVVVLQLRPLW